MNKEVTDHNGYAPVNMDTLMITEGDWSLPPCILLPLLSHEFTI